MKKNEYLELRKKYIAKFNDDFFNIFMPEEEAIKIYKNALKTGIPYKDNLPEDAIV